MSVSSSEVDETNATIGLTTPMLNDGERFHDAQAKQSSQEPKDHPDSTVFDIALDIDAKTKQLLQMLGDNELAINERLDRINDRIANVKKAAQ